MSLLTNIIDFHHIFIKKVTILLVKSRFDTEKKNIHKTTVSLCFSLYTKPKFFYRKFRHFALSDSQWTGRQQIALQGQMGPVTADQLVHATTRQHQRAAGASADC